MNFRRITSGASWIPQIDGLRFAAIASVVVFHLYGEVVKRGLHPISVSPQWQWLVSLITNGDRGVLVFYVISGFILARPFLREYRLGGHKVDLRRYFLRRITRLEPPYILSLLIGMVAFHIYQHWTFAYELPHFLAHVFYVHNLFYYGSTGSLNYVVWTLEIEVQFYILAPALCSVYRIENTFCRRSILVALVTAAGFVSLAASSWAHFSILNFAQYFFAGLLVADLVEFPRHSNRQNYLWDVVTLAGWPLLFWLPRTNATAAWLPFLILPLFLAAFYGKATNWFFRQPAIALTGGMCYSIYLMQAFIMSLSFHAIKHIYMSNINLTVAIQIALLAVPVLLGSTVYFVFIERPCMDPLWPQKILHHLGLGRHKPCPAMPSN